MEKTIQTQEVLTNGKAVYVKPTSQVYELEVEGAILQASIQGENPPKMGYDEEGWE
jgi:hypothetical protein